VPEVISDTSPLQYPFQADCLDLLPTLYGRVLVPAGVAAEVQKGRDLGMALPNLATLDWIRIESVNALPVKLLATDLGLGEREVLGLAKSRSESLAILDDGVARHHAKLLGLNFTGTLGVLLKAKEVGHLESVAPVVARLARLGFRLDPRTRAGVLRLAGEE
jgi:predicted nucleic acid-binding protein